MGYELFVLTDRAEVANLANLEIKLRLHFLQLNYLVGEYPPNVTLETKEELTLKWSDFKFTIIQNTDLYVLEESQEIAKNFPQYPNIKKCDRRLELCSDDDYEMDYFNDYIFIIEVLEKLNDVYIYELCSGKILNK